MTQTDAEVLVVGAGVIGLTTAVCLAEAGVSVTLAAAQPPQETTSIAAGALWEPYLVGMDDRIRPWAMATASRLAELTSPAVGANELAGIVRNAAGVWASTEPDDGEPPEYAIGSPQRLGPDDVPAGYVGGWRLTAPLIAMPQYLSYLAGRYDRAGGRSSFPEKFGTLADARAYAPAARVIVNASGAGARELVPDPGVVPARGQAVVVRNPGLTDFFVGTGGDWPLTYMFPHGDVVVLGGTQQHGATSREPDPETALRILAACAAARPELRDAQVLGHRVGLRPVRPSVRLEAEQRGDVTIVHNYGHGGGGVTLSWGCAEDATRLALAALAA